MHYESGSSSEDGEGRQRVGRSEGGNPRLETGVISAIAQTLGFVKVCSTGGRGHRFYASFVCEFGQPTKWSKLGEKSLQQSDSQ